ncbi:hypothetical protein HY572_03285 [Candidatus Micrarchaeota archaeon]|nr:hypothetical protein [Candidatus Micrarchaeota archaeon]
MDTWKQKSWYNIISPKFLGEVQVAQIVASDEDHLLNRILALPLKEITHDISHMYTTIRIRVESIKNQNAYTKFIGHEASREYLSTLGRRRRELLRVVLETESKDGVKFTVKMLVVTAVPCSTPKKKVLRNMAEAELKKLVQEARFGDFIQDVLYNKISPKIHNLLKKITPIKRVEVYKTELYEVFDETEVIELERQKKAREQPASEENQAAAPSEAPKAETETEEKTDAESKKPEIQSEPTPA